MALTEEEIKDLKEGQKFMYKASTINAKVVVTGFIGELSCQIEIKRIYKQAVPGVFEAGDKLTVLYDSLTPIN